MTRSSGRRHKILPLSPPQPIKKGKGGLPRILSLASEKAKEWYAHPGQCPPLQSRAGRQTRSERRQALQIVIEFMLSRLDLATMALGTPTLAGGFIDISMKNIIEGTGLEKRRCERVIAQLKKAGFMEVRQPRRINHEGAYIGLRAIRIITENFFEWLGLSRILNEERKKALTRLKIKALKANRQLGNFINRLGKKWSNAIQAQIQKDDTRNLQKQRWRRMWKEFIQSGLDVETAQHKTNQYFGYPANWSPGMV